MKTKYLRSRVARLCMVPVTAAIIAVSTTACQPAITITQTSQDPGKTLRHDWGPAIVIESGVANSCISRGSDVSGREHLCRVVDGYEAIGDNRNWKLDIPKPSQDGAYLAVRGSNSSQYGYIVVVDGGQVFSGCTWYSPSNDYLCDYRERKQIPLKTSGNAYSYVLRKLWKWSKYTGNTLGCAGGIAGLWYGGKITAPLLADCVDGPM